MLLKIFLKDDVLRAVGNFLEPIDAWKFMMLSTQTRNQRQNNILWATLCVRDYGDDVSAKASSEENVVIDNDSGEHSLLESELESENGNDNDKYKISSSIRNEIAYFSSYQEPGSLFQLLAHVALRLKPGIQVNSLVIGNESLFSIIARLMPSSCIRIPHTPSFKSDRNIIHAVLSGMGEGNDIWFKSLSSDFFRSNRLEPRFHGWSGFLRLRFALLNVLDEKYYMMLYSNRTNRIIASYGSNKRVEWWKVSSDGMLTYVCNFEDLKASIRLSNARHMEVELHFKAFNWLIGIDYDRKFYASTFRKYWPRGRGI
mmetsp:Transcript_25754/g.31651  ORF Transcript_25754/g.31651 Transcript_25754/m.31651 type:complete len:314 (+) Transcript_25754:80-1021(+)